MEGTHGIRIEVLIRSPAVINGMAAHHGNYEPKSMEAALVRLPMFICSKTWC